MTDEKNENWGECPKCGSPVLIDSSTGTAEACAVCAAESSPSGLYGGGLIMIVGLIFVALLIYISVKLLLG